MTDNPNKGRPDPPTPSLGIERVPPAWMQEEHAAFRKEKAERQDRGEIADHREGLENNLALRAEGHTGPNDSHNYASPSPKAHDAAEEKAAEQAAVARPERAAQTSLDPWRDDQQGPLLS